MIYYIIEIILEEVSAMKEMARIIDNKKKNPEDRQYLICISAKDGEDDSWQIITGRTNAYEYLKDNIDFINFDESFILVESCTLEQRKSIYAFLKHVEQFYEDSFDVDDYVKGDWSEDAYRTDNGIDDKINIDNSDRIGMMDIMNDNIAISQLSVKKE